MELFLDPQLLRLTVTLAAPFVIAALGELIIERSGVLNVAIEGLMAVGAASGFLATFTSGGNYALGLGTAMAVGGLMALTLAIFSVTLRTDQITVGLALLVFGLGLASLLYRAVIGVKLAAPVVPISRTGRRPPASGGAWCRGLAAPCQG